VPGTVTTERMVLRPVTLDDVDALVALDGDPEVMRYLSGGRPTPRDEVIDTIRENIHCRWIAARRPTNDFVGWFGLVPTGSAEYAIGYRLRRATWGCGLATEGARALIALAFTELGAHRICAETMAVNLRSRRVMERCGMRHVRTFHLEWHDPIPGTEFGEVEYELLRTDGETTQASPTRRRVGGSRW
jgi:RimJ/RimL family protein N-acetyltransferase